LAAKRQCLSVKLDNQLWVLFAKEVELKDLNWLSYIIKEPFNIAQIENDFLTKFIVILNKYTNDLSSEQQNIEQDVALLQPNTINESQVVRLVNTILSDAYQFGASDIHFENTADGLIIK
ncbi:type II/IV secretion system protein, partial [Acinetobacter baumannii]